MLKYNIVTCLLKARIVELEETAIAREWLGKCFRSNRYAYNNRTCWRLFFSMWSMPRLYQECQLELLSQSAPGRGVGTEESPLLEAVG
jgi:hypothetical protein